MSASSDSSVPSIRTFQMDSSAVGVLTSSVNLFRGDVNYTQTLFSLPGRSDNDGLQIDLSIQYQSNVNQQAMGWNRDQPTGVLGMGWDLPLASVRMEDANAPTPGLRSYTISISGNTSQMVREPASSALFAMDAALAAQLVDGQPVPADVRQQFVSRGLPLSTQASVVGSASPWMLRDDALEQEFVLTLAAGALQAADGGEAYQLTNYRFWKVLYYPRYERWSVTNEAGQRMSFGGGVGATAQGYRTSAGNSIEWGVQWLDGSGVPVWQGTSSRADGQQQYARAWHLERAFSRFGESVSYAYNCFDRGSDGLLPEVEQLVAAGGKPYTKACYLGQVTDVFGRTARFQYGAKLWSDASAGSPREYADPHKAVPGTTPNGFQDRYETRFLESIDVHAADGGVLFSVGFDYEPQPGSPVANVAGTSGDTCKRLLTAITLYNADDTCLPGYGFDYLLDIGAGGNLGALDRITWPTGGTARYDYASVSLPICDRTLAVGAPSPMPVQSIPRVWFGPDYAVVLWNNTSDGRLAMQVFTWNGQWVAWQADPGNALLLDDGSGGTSLSTVQVEAGEDFVAISYQTSSKVNLHLFRKDMARPGQWVAAAIPGGGTGGRNSPSWTWDISAGAVQVFAGGNFVFVAQMSASTTQGSTDRFSWYWPDQAWQHEHVGQLDYRWFSSGRDHVASIDLNGNVNLDWADALGAWHSAAPVNLGFRLNTLNAIALAGDSSLLAVSHLTSGSASMGQFNYDVWLVQWNQDYVLATPTKFSFQDKFASQFPTSWSPVAIDNALVAVAGNVMRFDGATWTASSALMPTGIVTAQQRYAYGPDYAVQVLVPTVGAPTAQLQGYDPTVDAFGALAPIRGLSTPQMNSATANWIGAGVPDYLTVGTQLFFRGVATNWGDAVASNIADLQALVNASAGNGTAYQLNSASMVNEGPAFLACALYDNGSNTGHATAACALVLRNGNVYGPAQILDGQSMWTAQEQDQPGQGTYPGGPSAFFSYPDTAGHLDAATTVYLNRYAGNAVQGPISHWPVSAITIDDGLSEAFTTSFVADTANAACDTSGQVVKYFQTAVYPGGSEQEPVNGSVVSCYLNGNADVTGADWYNMLDGLLKQVTTFDAQGNPLNDTSYDWQAYVQRAGDPNDPAAPPRQLYGAFVLQTGQATVRDGVPSSQTTGFVREGFAAPYNGQPIEVTAKTVNGAGVDETDVRSYRYACELDATSNLLNDMSSALEQRVTRDGVTTGVSVMALTSWPTSWGDDVTTPAEAADFAWIGGDSDFPFASWQPGDVPAGWQTITRLQQRTPAGAAQLSYDGAGVASATLFAVPQVGLPVAVFRDALLSECAWCGFQSYEDTSAWQMAGTSTNGDQAWLGETSLNLGVGGRLATTVTPSLQRRTYLLALRYLTPAGYSGGSGAITVDTGAQPHAFDLVDSNGAWTYFTAPVSLPGDGSPVSLAIANAGSATVLIDGVLLMPLDADVTVQSWRPSSRLLLATMSASGACDFTRYDRYQRTLGAVGPSGQWQELDVRFLSRQGSANDRFEDASPNAELTLQFASDGRTETFRDGNGWQSRWRPGNPGDWSTRDGCLYKAGNGGDTLTWQAASTGSVVAFYLEMLPSAAPAGSLSLRFGQAQSIAWTVGSGWSWTDGGAVVQAPLASPPQLAQQWLLLLGGGQVQFFADGQLIFSAASAITPDQGLQFATGPNALRLSQLGYGGDPRLGLSYTDGAARQRQVHQRYGNDSRISAAIYDALDRTLASTKIAPGSFGASPAPAMAYRAGFVDVAAFLQATRDSWRMDGEVSDYYAGQTDGAVQRSNDQGYPYHGTRYEGSAQSRALESGQPGLALSIHDIATVPMSQRQTARMDYGASQAGDPVPAGQLYATQATTPGGYIGRQLIDTSQRAAGMVQQDAQGATVGQSAVAPTYSEAQGSEGITTALRLPNAFTQAPQSQPAAYVRTSLNNPLGQVVQYDDPDSGRTLSLYNGKGQLRFVQPALDAGQQFFLYTRFDGLGRILEEGLVNAEWNPATLLAQIDNPDWPTAQDGAVVGRAYRYDGDGTDANALGRLLQVTTYNPAPSSDPGLGDCQVTESWSYDAEGRVTSARMQVAGAATLDATARYQYNNLNEVVRIDLPEGSPLAAITYHYDDQGHIVAIGVPGDDDAIAAYTWTANGELQTATRGHLSELWNYDSPGRIALHQASVDGAPVFSQAYAYTPDSNIQQRTTTQDNAAASASTDAGYTYDGQQRLATVAVANGAAGNLSIDSIDANGNIWAATADGVGLSTPCTAGTDRLASAQIGQAAQESISYNASGHPTHWRNLDIGYDPALTAVATLRGSGDAIRYARGLNNQRVLRQQGDSRRLYFCGAGSTPLLIWKDGVAQLCIWGPDGLAAVHDGTLQYPVSDHQHTTWAVFDADGRARCAFDYAAFGAVLARGGTGADDWLFLFGGKEFDTETGLYDFGARFYDPALLRFLGPDPARQFSSPYVFASNNPLNFMDPSGNISVWAQVGIGAAMVVLAIAGIALSAITFGAAAPAVAGGEAALAGAAVAGEGAAVAAGAAAGAGGVAGAEAAGAAGALGAEAAAGLAAEGAGAAAGEVAAGAGAAAVEGAVPLTTAQVVAQNVASVAWSATTSAITGAGTGGLTYDIQHGRDFTAKGFFAAMGLGALGGAISGGFTGLATMPATLGLTQGMSIGGTIAFRALTQGVAGMVGKDVSTLVTDAISGQKITASSLLMSSLTGFGMGAASGAFSGLRNIDPSKAAVNAPERLAVRAGTAINKFVDGAKAAATSETALCFYVPGGFLLAAGYATWGAVASNQRNG